MNLQAFVNTTKFDHSRKISKLSSLPARYIGDLIRWRYCQAAARLLRRYLFSRVGLPAVISLLVTPVLLWIFHISHMDLVSLPAISLLGSVMGTIVSLMIVSLSTNKLEGMAATKMSALLTLGILPPFFIKGNAERLFGILPSYWLSKVILEKGIPAFAIGLLVSGVWIALLARKFNKKVSVF